MNFEEHDYGIYRIYTGAIEGAALDGYAAAVVVKQVSGLSGPEHEVYRDETISGGHRWATCQEALRAACKHGKAAVDRRNRATHPSGRMQLRGDAGEGEAIRFYGGWHNPEEMRTGSAKL